MMTSNAAAPATAPSAGQQSFVINLCSSTSPMALAHPGSPELKRYTFFVSRQREDGRERFRLHMGYFATQEQADELLVAVRDVYPAAWAGPAPTQGVARRGRIAPVALAPSVAQAANAAPSRPTPSDAAADKPLEQTMSEMRSVLAKLDEDSTAAAPTVIASTVVASTVDAPTVIAPAPEAPTVQMPRPLPPTAKPVRPAEPPRLQPVSQPKVAAVVAKVAELSPAQTLKVLEGASTPASGADAPNQKVRVLTPEDTQTLTDIKLDKDNNAPPCFAVQLVWSVTTIDADAVPHLAIFDAYTLYNVEGTRQGRKWYGLRLGFFSDPNSAAQVANYVRSDYSSVAVIPVSSKERDRAGGGSDISPADSGISPPLKASDRLSTNREAMDGFELVADDRPVPQKRDLDMPKEPQAQKGAAITRTVRTLSPVTLKPVEAAPKAATGGKPTGKRVVVRKKPDARIQGAPGRADVLESTLELLGASTLTLDEGGGMVIDEAAVRRATDERKPANNRFSRLLSRLGGG
jgi:hypothetical protein